MNLDYFKKINDTYDRPRPPRRRRLGGLLAAATKDWLITCADAAPDAAKDTEGSRVAQPSPNLPDIFARLSPCTPKFSSWTSVLKSPS
jgi:hypothetical protein